MRRAASLLPRSLRPPAPPAPPASDRSAPSFSLSPPSRALARVRETIDATERRGAAAFACGAALLYAAALTLPNGARRPILPLYDCVVLPAVLLGIFAVLNGAARRVNGERARFLGVLGVSFVLCGAFLLRLWIVGYEGRNAVFAGIFPWSDSADFYSDALRLLHGRRFTPVSSRRPLFAALLAGLLKLFGGGLRPSLAVLAAVSALAMTVATVEVWRTSGWRSALVVYVVLVFFERRWTGFVQTEHLGFPFGALGFALIWRTATARRQTRSPAAIGASVFALAFGMFARAGCFFVLPAIAVWTLRRGRSGEQPREAGVRRWTALAPFAAAVVGAALALAAHETVLGVAGSGTSFSDYPPIAEAMLYGEDFTHLATTHPFIDALPAEQRAAAGWAVVGEELRERPWLLPVGLARSFVAFFVSPYGAFSCVWTNPDDAIFEDGPLVSQLWESGGAGAILGYWRDRLGFFSIVNALAMGALGVTFVAGLALGLLRLVRRRSAPEDGLLLAVSAGVLASVPFTPPWITSGVQVQTVTLAFVAAVPAMLLSGASSRRPPAAEMGTAGVDRVDGAIGATIALLAGAFGVLFVWVRLAPERPPTALASVDRATAHRVHLDDASVEVASARSLSVRRKGLGDLGTSMAFLVKHNEDLTESLAPSLTPGTLYRSAYDEDAESWELLVDPERRLASATGWVVLSSTPLRSPRARLVASGVVFPRAANAR